MNSDVWIQLIVTLGAVVTGFFGMFKFFIGQSVKREKLMLEYFEVKNGHMERMQKDFTKTINKNSSAITKLAQSIK